MFIFEQDPPRKNKPAEAISIVNMSRREFLKLSALAAGSTFVLGVFGACDHPATPGLPRKATPTGTMAEASFQPDLLIGINDAGDVFIVCTRSEMGQGIRTGMPAVIADELEADWQRVYIVQADGDPKYGNQNTDGSRSVRNHFDQWRKAGATARAMLIAAAAQAWNTTAAECEALNHTVKHKSSGKEIGYGKLAAIAATLEVPENPSLKPRDQWKYIGKPLDGVDNYDIVTGKAIFGADAAAPGMLYAVVERCPVLGGRVKSYQAEAALKTPGVRKVIALLPATLPPAFKALGGLAVVADNTWAAIQGRKALQVEWDYGPNANYDSEQYRIQLEQSAADGGRVIRTVGDVDAARKKAAKTVEALYYVPMLAHAPMEPPHALAWVKEDGHCEIWAPTQNPQSARKAVAQSLGLEPEQVTVHVTLLGGGFGRKSKPDYIVEAALVSREMGAPVKLTWTREDELRFDYYHAPSAQYLQAALDENGKATTWLHRTSFPSISSTFAPGVNYASDGELGLGFTTVPYDIPNMRLENGPASAHVRIGWLRSVCNIHHAFAVNAFAGELAHAAGRDQKEYLLELIGPPRSLNHLFKDEKGAYGEDLNRQPYHTGRLRGVIELAAQKAGWGTSLPEGHGRGIAAHFSFVSYTAMVVQASVKGNRVTVHRVDCAVDCGLYVNPDRVKAQMEGAIVFGLTLALHGRITARNGAVVQSNFHDYPLLRLKETPEIHVHIIHSDAPPGGVGEPGTPPVAPALTNAILAITGKPVRELPIRLG